MKVRDVQEVQPAEQAEPVKGATSSAAVADRVTANQAAQVEATLSQVRANAGSARSARLAQIAAAVRDGSYRPSPNRIADQILASAELEARLRALLMH